MSRTTPLFIVIIMLIWLSGLYFYNKNDSFAKKEHCTSMGNAYFKEELRDRNYVEGSVSSLIDSPQFSYNRKYNSCFYLNSSSYYSGNEIAKTEYYIIDLASNEKVASYTRWDKGNDGYLTNEIYIDNKKKFDELEKEIFQN